MEKYQFIDKTIAEIESVITSCSDSLWDYSELSLKEFRSCALFTDVLRQEGFDVTEHFNGIETAFRGSFGSGRPYIGILAEYDALSGLSQQACSSEKIPEPDKDNGHGCGHNLLGSGALGAAIILKRYLETHSVPGTVFLYGCPGEEGIASKTFFARDGIWKDLDAALTWHPSDANEVVTGSSNSCIQIRYDYHGVASHASSSPEKGRSALDAVELMNIGVQFLREHMSDSARIHYSIIDAGGVSPNVVQSHASVLYMIRSPHVKEALKLKDRVDRIAAGASLMTDTTVESRVIDGLSELIPNKTLELVLYQNFTEIGVPSYTDSELEFADKLYSTYSVEDYTPGLGSIPDPKYRLAIRSLKSGTCQSMNSFLFPHYQGDCFEPGSTDVGDVSWQCPTAQIHVSSWTNGSPGHSWQNVSIGKHSIAKKALLTASKVLAAAAIDLLNDPDILVRANEELALRTEGQYLSPIPADCIPVSPF